MIRNLDLVALRSFVTVAESGGVTRAAGLLNLTQSAVSMQIRRLEDSLALQLFCRSARRMSLSGEGEQLLTYARRMLELNDEALARLTADVYEGELRIGVPHDIVYPQIPMILQRFAALYPRMRINLVSSFTTTLKAAFGRGELDFILTTEENVSEDGEVLAERELVWIGAPGGTAAQKRPLRLAFEERCRFRPLAIAALDRADIPWEMAFDGQSEHVMEATAAADLAVTVRIDGVLPHGCALVPSEANLPDLGWTQICLYRAGGGNKEIRDALAQAFRQAYGGQGLREPLRLHVAE